MTRPSDGVVEFGPVMETCREVGYDACGSWDMLHRIHRKPCRQPLLQHEPS